MAAPARMTTRMDNSGDDSLSPDVWSCGDTMFVFLGGTDLVDSRLW